MDFNDTKEEAQFRQQAKQWLEENIVQFKQEFPFEVGDNVTDSQAAELAKAWQKRKFEGGWGCLTWPKAFGGREVSIMEATIFAQEEAKVMPLAGMYIITSGMAVPTIMTHGTEEQCKQLLPSIANGERLWCQLFSEPAAGSDLAGIKTRAVKDGDDWIINGQKVWTTLAHVSDWAILVVRTDPTVAKHKGLTYFVIDMKSPGVEVRPIKQASGESEFNEVFLTDVRIPDSQRLDAVGNGWRVAMTTLMNERVAVGGAFSDNVEEILEVARTTPLGQGRAIDDCGVRQSIADWYVKAAGLKNIGLRQLSTLSKGGVPGPEASVSKLVLGIGRQDLAAMSLDILDMAGVLAEDDAMGWGSHDFFRTIGNRLEGGTDEILRNIISERVLGLPAEIRVDKDVPFNQVPSGA
ncbi:acyl-CoA dehydrogenase [Pseudomaricurvus alkylphenolicus]|uniref:acyl-CoA dehydrogenase family protein n=1 Tax=Pseudomaricurvus alkylphenolicus TaxID=1306991 RepID=UPI0014227FBD|nr:acyl-CoA dehydrogenase family protein [Pseudomaricurvus alkylphenolicus]NIB42435.1 acyl-CoA dehydrogenase [Pseudomaricurvus alkylphenolicus]